MTEFQTFNIPNFLLDSLKSMGIVTPTPVQQETMPLALEGKDVLASAQTGTGKTIAYLIPLIANLVNNPKAKAVVLAPTRELAIQIKDTTQKLLTGANRINFALLIGGERMFGQLNDLKKGARIIIGTPGRINDHLDRGSLNLKNTNFWVLDETDRMLDMGFTEQLDFIKTHLPDTLQTLMFSATLPTNILSLSQKYLNNPERISIGPENQPSPNVKQAIIHTSEEEKLSHLRKELSERSGSIIIFVKTKRGADNLTDTLKKDSHKVDTIHGDLNQSRRQRAIAGFRNGRSRILVATDVAARGLDVPHVEHVINFDLPMQAEDYVHRIGRTGRAGAEGSALSLVSPDDRRKWKIINRLINPEEKSGFRTSETPFSRKPQNKPKQDSWKNSNRDSKQRPRDQYNKNGFGSKRKANNEVVRFFS